MPEQVEEDVLLPARTQGCEVVEYYRSHGLSPHPLTFLRAELSGQEISPCTALRTAKSGSRITVSRPLSWCGSGLAPPEGIMFVTLEDETDIGESLFHLAFAPR